MSQTSAIVATLKSLLKARDLTYRHVAEKLQLSEASIKRLFAEESFSLQRLDQICQLLDLQLSDLIKHMESEQQQLTQLSLEQEREITSDIKLLLIAFLVVNGWQFTDILHHYKLCESETIGYLATLDRIKLIELLPNNRIRLLISPKFSWRRNGPIMKFFTENLQQDFLKSRFDNELESFQFVPGILSKESCEQLKRKIQQLTLEFHQLNEKDRALALDQRASYSLVVAFRNWRPNAFERLRKPE